MSKLGKFKLRCMMLRGGVEVNPYEYTLTQKEIKELEEIKLDFRLIEEMNSNYNIMLDTY